MKRIGVFQVWQETNFFNPVLTRREDFEKFQLIPDGQLGQSDEVSGFVKGLDGWAETVGLLQTQAWCSGPLSKDTRIWLGETIKEQLTKAGKLDGILFSLHGALVAEDETDVDGFLLEQVRNVVGKNIPVVATTDLHAFWTPKMFELADTIVAYHTNPHIDRCDTGIRGAKVLKSILEGAVPVVFAVRLPILVTGEVTATTSEYLLPVFERLKQIEEQDDVLSATILMVQPWLDVPDVAGTVAVFTDNQPQLGRELTEELADMFWQQKENMKIDFLDAAESITKALKYEGKPVIIADGPDATNSGAGGDSIHLLREMLNRKIPGGALAFMVDPQAVAVAKEAGPGGIFDFAVGGKRDNIFSKPLPVTGQVLFTKPARYVLSGHLGDNLPIDMGMAAAVRIGNVTLLLVERTGPGSTPLMYRCVGLEPKDYKLVVVKSPAGFRADFGPFAAGIVLSSCPGCASPRLTEMPYKNITHPIIPFEQIDDWRQVKWAGALF